MVRTLSLNLTKSILGDNPSDTPPITSIKHVTIGESVVLLLQWRTIQRHYGTTFEIIVLEVRTPPFLQSVCVYVGQHRDSASVYL